MNTGYLASAPLTIARLTPVCLVAMLR